MELMYARHLLTSWPGECFSVLAISTGPRVFNRISALEGLGVLEALWGEGTPEMARPNRIALALRRAFAIRKTLGTRPQGLPFGTIYLNVGQISLSRRGTLAWLERRTDVRTVFMLHDLIPVEHPQYIGVRERRYFNRILTHMGYADGVILNSHAVASSYAPLAGDAEVFVCPLPVDPAFLGGDQRPKRAEPPYFVACGQIEPRKNFGLLVEVWDRLCAEPAAPKLIIVGSHGDSSAALGRSINLSSAARDKICLLSGLTTGALRQTLDGATALLAPSLAEGFDLPVAEALSLGVPVVASDIPAHRETAAGRAVLLPGDDPDAWLRKIRELRDSAEAAADMSTMARAYKPNAPGPYFEEIERFLLRVRSRPQM